MRSTPYYYILTLIILGSLPLLIYLRIPKVKLYTRITPLSSWNFDTRENNQFKITGQVNGENRDIFIDLYQKNSYQVGPLNFTKFRYVKTISANGQFVAPGLDGGEYLVVPKSKPWEKIFFAKKYFLRLADHDPSPLVIAAPTSSVFQFMIDMLTNSSYYKQ